jgi:quercetin dioxygenase-like cupin family protein
MITAETAAPMWFLATTVRILVSHADGENGISLIESHAAHGDSPPLHVHDGEDEAFHVLEGVLRLRVGGEELRIGAGDAALAPRGVPHTYRVESEEARWLVATGVGDFERFVRELSRPAERDGLPPQTPPTPEQAERLHAVAASHGIRLVGPPLGPNGSARIRLDA